MRRLSLVLCAVLFPAQWMDAAASVCGPTDDTQDVELYDGSLGPSKESIAAWQPAIGLIRWNSSFIPPLTAADDPGMTLNTPWCTATLISDKLVITAGNCLESDSGGWATPRRQVDGSLVSLAPQELALLMHVRFNYQRDATKCVNPAEPRTCEVRKTDAYPVVRLLEHMRGGLNYAILELGPGSDGQLPGERYSPAKVDTSSAALAEAKMLTIIQHPNASPKRVGAGVNLKINNDRILYGDIDTFGNSGGSGIFDQRGRVIGVHTSGGCDITGGENKGLTIRAISQVSDVIH
jgi:hypothetical protein